MDVFRGAGLHIFQQVKGNKIIYTNHFVPMKITLKNQQFLFCFTYVKKAKKMYHTCYVLGPK